LGDLGGFSDGWDGCHRQSGNACNGEVTADRSRRGLGGDLAPPYRDCSFGPYL
jgi:hypothetical protein